jgi:predicted DNA-binding transcriptional regulator AlpA
MGRRVDVDDLLDARGVADEIGLTHRNNVYKYRRDYPDFPQPLVTHGRCYLWHRPDIQRWIRSRGKR